MRPAFRLPATLVAAAALSLPAAAQTVTAALTGTVTDSSAAVVTGVGVTARNTATNLTYNTRTNQAGVYDLLFLPIGSYEVTAEAPGFKRVVLGPFQLEVNQRARVDIQLEVGAVTESVEVRDIAPILQTDSSQTGDTISSTQAASLPLNGRNIASLTLLMPGVVSPNPGSFTNPARAFSGGRPYVNGNREQTNTFMLDGVEIGESTSNVVGYNPNVDALAEVRVLTGNGNAEFGNSSGATVLMSLKSGTNDFHGNLFEFFRNDKLDANGFFQNRARTARRALRRNIYGGTLGGPLVRNRHFFFMDYEGTRQRSSGPATASVAPAAFRNGDLSVFTRTIRDPLGGVFPGNIIPPSRIANPAAQALYRDSRLYPLPNNAGAGAIGVTSNYISSSNSYLDNDQGDVKIDSRLSDKDNVWGRLSVARYRTGDGSLALPTSVGSVTDAPTLAGVITWTRTFSAALVNEARIGYTRIAQSGTPNDPAGLLGLEGNQKLGIPGGQPVAGASRVQLGEGLSDVGSVATASTTSNHTFQYGNNLTWQTGRHLVKFGGQALRYRQNRYYSGNNGVLGRFDYSGKYTGNAHADFLLNLLTGKGRGSQAGKWGHRTWRAGLFFQDDFKIRSNFTLNLGMRWEYAQPIYEVADRQASIDLASGKVLYAGKDGNSRALYRSNFRQFMPRIGFGWTPGVFDKKVVIRAAYGITTFLEGTGTNLRLPLNPPFFFESDITYDLNAPGDIRTGFVDVQPRPEFAGQVRAWNPDLQPAFTEQWNFSLERQITNRLSATLAYVGQRGRHLINAREYNQPLPDPGPVNQWRPLNQRRPLYGVAPLITNISGTDSSSNMHYHSLQANARRRMSGGLELLVAYTLSRTLSDSIGFYGSSGSNNEGAYWQNAYDRRNNYGPAFFDVRHNLSIGGIYELPLGQGKRFGGNLRGAAGQILGGWNVQYVMSAHSGFPVTIQSNDLTNQATRGGIRPNRYRSLDYSGRDIDAWFGRNAFCTAGADNGTCPYGEPAPGRFGNAGVGTETAPSFFNLDLSVGKQFRISEYRYIDFRAEFFNLPNSVSFGPPARNISSPTTFGQITSQINSPRNIQFALKYYF
ncbi:MAG: TonB-dependent receptor [Bryobacterales bacterium]|nr:TonB-dependent receptor [Bryobacterales bacterium]